MPEVKTHGFEGWWPMRVFMGKTGDGLSKVYGEGFVNMTNGQVHHDDRGWDGEPPYPTGDLSNIKTASEAYRENYDKIRWD